MNNSSDSPPPIDGEYEYQTIENNLINPEIYIIEVEPTRDFLDELAELVGINGSFITPVTDIEGLDPSRQGFNIPHLAADYTEEGSSSDNSDNGCSEDEMCTLCSRRPKSVLFNSCDHSLCVSCVKKIWWSRIKAPMHWPTSFPCPYCRENVEELGCSVKPDGSSGPATTVTHWKPLKEWMTSRSKRAARRMGTSQADTNSTATHEVQSMV